MRQIFPPPVAYQSDMGDVGKGLEADPIQIYEIEESKFAAEHFEKTGRAWVVLNMISSLDGSAVGDSGLSGSLGGSGDKEIFKALRGAADFILVAANTVREEKYQAPKAEPEVRERRLERGQKPAPRLVILSASLSFGEEAAFLDEENPPIIYTTPNSPADIRAELEDKAEFRFTESDNAEDNSVDLSQLIEDLGNEGKLILVEGGPSLNGALLELSLIDKLCLTLSPQITGSEGPGIAKPPKGSKKEGLSFMAEMQLSGVLCDDESFLYLQLISKANA